VSLQLDNDSFATWPHDDRWYTSGLVARWVRETGDADLHGRVAAAWCSWADCGTGARSYRLTTLAHRIHTPADTARTDPQPHDRPYGAWLSIGTGVLVREPDVQQRIELGLGVVGPAALGEPVQNGVHRWLGLDESRGWRWQLRSRPAVQAGWSRLVRAGAPGARLDRVGRLALDAGTLRGVVSAGAMLRWGEPPAGPSWPGEPMADWGGTPDDTGRWHVFAGADLRLVGWDRLLDGPATGYASLARPEPLGGDVFAGASLRVARDWRVDLAMTLRSAGFDSPQGPAYPSQRYGTMQLRWSAP
jgi:hypothetical protein